MNRLLLMEGIGIEGNLDNIQRDDITMYLVLVL